MGLKESLEGKVLLNETTVTDIADKIRTKTGNSSRMLPSEMPGLIDTIKGEPTLQSKTVTPFEYAQSVTADSGYDGLDAVTVNAIPSTYVKPAATKGATAYLPKTTAQTIAAGTYCSGAQTIVGDANLIAENILSGKSIFGVAGSATGGRLVVGHVTVNNTTQKTIRISHDLGVEPTFAVIVRSKNQANANFVVGVAQYRYFKDGITYDGASIKLPTNDSVSTDKISAGVYMESDHVKFELVYDNKDAQYMGGYQYLIGVI
jgi:hypothetical protein